MDFLCRKLEKRVQLITDGIDFDLMEHVVIDVLRPPFVIRYLRRADKQDDDRPYQFTIDFAKSRPVVAGRNGTGFIMPFWNGANLHNPPIRARKTPKSAAQRSPPNLFPERKEPLFAKLDPVYFPFSVSLLTFLRKHKLQNLYHIH